MKMFLRLGVVDYCSDCKRFIASKIYGHREHFVLRIMETEIERKLQCKK